MSNSKEILLCVAINLCEVVLKSPLANYKFATTLAAFLR